MKKEKITVTVKFTGQKRLQYLLNKAKKKAAELEKVIEEINNCQLNIEVE